jgi:hypothetical protein
MPNKSYTLLRKAQQNVAHFTRARINSFDFGQRRTRMEIIDQALQLEHAKRKIDSNKDRRRDYYDSIETAQISPAIDTIQGFLVDLFLSTTPIFPAVSNSKTDTSIVHQVDAINEDHGRRYAWARHYALFFRDLAKYNIGATEVSWHSDQQRELAPSSGTADYNQTEVPLQDVTVSGNSIRRLDLYNTFYDDSVPVSEIHERGEHGGYIERMTLVELVRRIRSMKASGGKVMNESLALQRGAGTTSKEFFIPDVMPSVASESARNQDGNWENFFSDIAGGTNKKYQNASLRSLYEVTTIYARIIPSMFGINNVPEKDTLQIWKFVIVGEDIVLFAQRLENVHSYLPIVFGQLREDGIGEQVKSTAELLVPLQNLSSKLYDARLAALARMNNDRMAYMDGIVDSASVNSNNPTSKIKVRPSALVKDIRQALYPIPWRDEIGPTIINELQNVNNMSERVTRLNRPQLGQFQRGNKTLGEFQTVMANANAELRVMGLLIENAVLHPTKTIIKYNIMQFQPVASVNTHENGEVSVNPNQLRNSNIEFKLADGLVTRDEMADASLVREMLIDLRSDPNAAMEYDLNKLREYLYGQAGIDVTPFHLSQEDREKKRQQLLAQGVGR